MTLAIVTGAGSGIGQATAVRLAARGLSVLCTGRTEESLLNTSGATRTAMLKAYIADATLGLTADEIERMRISDASRSLLARVAQPDEVAATVVHLALDATATTGVDVPVDLGYSAS